MLWPFWLNRLGKTWFCLNLLLEFLKMLQDASETKKIPDFTRYVSLIQDFLCCQIVSRETPFFVVTLEAVAENLLVKFMSSSCPHPSVDL